MLAPTRFEPRYQISYTAKLTKQPNNNHKQYVEIDYCSKQMFDYGSPYESWFELFLVWISSIMDAFTK